jgi:uncharacterized damage-inducible protein DinB
MSNEQLMIQSALANWKLTMRRATDVFFGFTEEQFYQEIAPGKNRPIYVLGHLVAIHDATLALLGLGERSHPDLDETFIKMPDRTVENIPSPEELKKYWTELNRELLEKFQTLTAEQWLQRHMAMSDEDYSKDPTRNRFSVLLNRTNHTAYHLGQLVLARK